MKNGQAEESRRSGGSIVQCPKCFSYNAELLWKDGPKACCLDCDKVYPVKFRHVDRAEIDAAPPCDPCELGPVSEYLASADARDPQALMRAHHRAAKLAKKFGEEFENKWFLETPWLKSFDSVHRARARYALEWRPRFLALLSLSRSTPLAARGAKVSPQVVWYHRRNDRDFDEQCGAAEEHAIQLVHDACFKSVVEGDLEPIYWQGIQVGHVRKFDSRLRVEFLRAYMPDRFKTAGVNVNIGAKGDLFILTEEQRHKLMEYNRQWLLTAPIEGQEEIPASHSVTQHPEGVTD